VSVQASCAGRRVFYGNDSASASSTWSTEASSSSCARVACRF